MKHFELIWPDAPIGPLVELLDAHPELWDAHQQRRMAEGSPHARMADIWLRYNDVVPYMERGSLAGFNDAHVPIWYPAYEVLRPALRPILAGLLDRVGGIEMLGGVLITRIPPGEGIGAHTDSSWHVDYFEKFYVTLKSESGADFCCDHEGVAERLNPRPGEVWLFDNHKRHWVENRSAGDRVTLIVCLRRLK